MYRVAILASFAAALSLSICVPPRAHADQTAPAEPCTLEEGPSGIVAAVIDGETLKLEDGTEVRLIGALSPRARDADPPAGTWALENEATKALSDLVLGKRVKLAFGGRRIDRYGRKLAHVYLPSGAADEWVQGALLDEGMARAYGLPESFICGKELLAHEAIARGSKLGLWANGIYAPKPAERPSYLMALRGKYERVVGKVEDVGVTKSATYLNFGPDRHTDFTVRIGKKVLAAEPGFANRVAGLKGVHVSVRGWIDRWDGPFMELADPAEIEVLDETPPALLSSAPVPATGTASEPASVSSPSPSQLDPQKEVRPAPPEGAGPSAVKL